MSTLNFITINQFRNLEAKTLTFSPRFNLFYGDNGSGKTSILESVYYLGLGKSFRTSNANKLIRHNAEAFCLFTQRMANNSVQSTLGIERNQKGERKIKLNGDFQASISPLTRLLPIQFMSPMSYRFFHDGPKLRRQHLDWALFHVEPSFLDNWRTLQRTLKQRNSALKLNQSLASWNAAFVKAAEQLDKQRQNIFEELEPLCQRKLEILLPEFSFKLHYQRGWATEKSLANLLHENQRRDQQLGYTYYGPQRADFVLLASAMPVQDVLSQGQQKLAAYALHLALGNLLQQKTGSSPIYLIDDLPSELDQQSRHKITQLLHQLEAQAFITGLSLQDFSPLLVLPEARQFHVEHGRVNRVETKQNQVATPLA